MSSEHRDTAPQRARRAVRGRAALRSGVLALALVLWPPGGASLAGADATAQMIERCAQGQSLAGFSQSAYAKALRSLEATEQEYSNCEERIRAAQLAAAGGNRTGGEGVGAAGAGAAGSSLAPPTPAEQATLAQAAGGEGATPVRVGRAVVDPGVVHVDIASALNSLPASLLALLAVLAALLVLAGVLPLSRRLQRRRRGRSPSPHT